MNITRIVPPWLDPNDNYLPVEPVVELPVVPKPTAKR